MNFLTHEIVKILSIQSTSLWNIPIHPPLSTRFFKHPEAFNYISNIQRGKRPLQKFGYFLKNNEAILGMIMMQTMHVSGQKWCHVGCDWSRVMSCEMWLVRGMSCVIWLDESDIRLDVIGREWFLVGWEWCHVKCDWTRVISCEMWLVKSYVMWDVISWDWCLVGFHWTRVM